MHHLIIIHKKLASPPRAETPIRSSCARMNIQMKGKGLGQGTSHWRSRRVLGQAWHRQLPPLPCQNVAPVAMTVYRENSPVGQTFHQGLRATTRWLATLPALIPGPGRRLCLQGMSCLFPASLTLPAWHALPLRTADVSNCPTKKMPSCTNQ